MNGVQPQFLSSQQVEHFLARGFIKIEGAVERELALSWGARRWAEIETDPSDVSTWTQTRHHLPSREFLSVREHAPDVWKATQDLVGPNWTHDWQWGDGLIFNLGDDSGEPWVAPADWNEGWHVDGESFLHFLDSPEQALLTVVLWTDVEPRGGGTFLAPDSVPLVARYLADHPEGVLPMGFPYREIKSQCRDFVEATGRAGDVYLMHPFLMHSFSRNWTRNPRVITNPPTHLGEPMKFNRENPADQTIIERVILDGLGVESYDFQPTVERRKIRPKRLMSPAEREQAEKEEAQSGLGNYS